LVQNINTIKNTATLLEATEHTASDRKAQHVLSPKSRTES